MFEAALGESHTKQIHKSERPADYLNNNEISFFH